MKSLRHWGGLAVLGLAGGFGAALQNGGQEALEVQVQELEKRVQDLENYAKAQSEAAAVLSEKLELSDKEGFTYGINPNSRVALLEGLRKTADTAQKNVPGVEEEDAEDAQSER